MHTIRIQKELHALARTYKASRLDSCLLGAPRLTITLVGLSETRNPRFFGAGRVSRCQIFSNTSNAKTEAACQGDCAIDYQCLSELSHLRVKSIPRDAVQSLVETQMLMDWYVDCKMQGYVDVCRSV